MADAHNKPRPHFEDLLLIFPWALSKLYTLWVGATYPFASLGRGVSIHYTFMVNRAMAPRIRLGSTVIISKDVWLNIIPEATDEVNIIIDDNCFLGPRTWISVKNHIHLEQDVKVGPSVLIMDHGHSYEKIDRPIRLQPATEGGRIRIERACSIGMGAAVLCSQGELVLGHHCTVAPNSVVLRSVPPYSVIEGNPGRVIGQMEPAGADRESPTSSVGTPAPDSAGVKRS